MQILSHGTGKILNVNYVKQHFLVSYYFKIYLQKIDCVDAEGKKFEIFEISKPDAPYIMLEILAKKNN